MGLETKTFAIQNRRKTPGKLYLDSKSLSFRSNEMKCEFSLGDSLSAKVLNGKLYVQQGQTRVVFELGSAAPKWLEKILNPPSRTKKLGIKPDNKVWLSVGFEKAFRDEIKETGATITRKLERSDLAIWKVAGKEQLSQFDMYSV